VTFKFPVKIFYADTDLMGIVYHANYLKYFDAARHEMFHQLGVQLSQLALDDRAFVVSEVHMTYRKPAFFEQSYLVHTRILKVNAASIVLNQSLVGAEQSCTEARIKLACVHLQTLKPMALPTNLKSIIVSMEKNCA
jgi:acyl-CoA thioester hydrolase